jgi:hypothetical protein
MKYVKDLVFITAIVVLSMMLFQQCKDKSVAQDEAAALANYKDTAMVYQARNGELVTYNTALQISEATMRGQMDSLVGAMKNLKIKNPTSYTTINEVVRIDSFPKYVFVHDTIPCAPFTKQFSIDSNWYKFDVTLTNKDFAMSNFMMPNQQDILVGTKKNGMFKKNEYIVTVQNTNPYMTTTGIQNYTIKPKTPFYNKAWFRALEVGGAFILGTRFGSKP